MSQVARRRRPRAYALAAVLVVFGPAALLSGLALASRLEGFFRRRIVVSGSIALGVVVASQGLPSLAHALAAWPGLASGGRGFWPAVVGWWAWALLLSPLVACLLELARPAMLGNASNGRVEAKAPVLGRQLAGDAVFELSDGFALISLERLKRHALVLGSSGSGKTETLLRLACGVAESSDWRIFFIDAKGEQDTMVRFFRLMHHRGRTTRLYPQEGYDGWRGSAQEIANRLIELIDFAKEGPAAYYRDIAVSAVRLACEAPGAPPRSSLELLERLSLRTLRLLYARDGRIGMVESFTQRQIDEVRVRYQAFFGALDTSLDSGWAFEDAPAGYLLLDGLRLKDNAVKLARFFTEDFIQFVTARKPATERVLLIVDEFSQIAQSANLADVVERTRSFGVAAVLAPQVIEGMGGPGQAARMIGSAHTVFLHSVPNPEEAVRIAGNRPTLDPTIDLDEAKPRVERARIRTTPRVCADDVRRLDAGTCYAMASGRAAKIAVEAAPNPHGPALPKRRSQPSPPPPQAKQDPIRP